MRRISSGEARKGITPPPARAPNGGGGEGDPPPPGPVPGGEGGGGGLAVGPGAGQLIEHLSGLVGVGGGVDTPELARTALALLPGEVAQALADEVDDAGLIDRLRGDGVDR